MISFTDAGSRLNADLGRRFTKEGMACTCYAVKRFAVQYNLRPLESDIKAWIGTLWGDAAFLFIGAAGIAVRYIAPWVQDKFTDSPVIIMDEKGEFVIPLLSGHVGGAVEIARIVSKWSGAIPVITTATDVQNRFAVDVFAMKNGLEISSRGLAKEISAALLEHRSVGFYSVFPVQGELPEGLIWCKTPGDMQRHSLAIAVLDGQESIEALVLHPESNYTSALPAPCGQENHILVLRARTGIIAGIGCRRGTPKEQLETGLIRILDNHSIEPEQICAFASIDLKKDEAGLLELAKEYKVPFKTFTAEQLRTIETVSSHSAFVERTTGVDNVCERAARLYCPEGELVQPKICSEGATFALVKDRRIIKF